jgi:hypothetical protein
VVDKDTYQQLEYLTLRKEIEDSLNRSFQIMVGGATLVPVLVGIVAYYAATAILTTLPMMVVVVALLYMNQWNSIMRCGRYIRTRIEDRIMGGEGGWEAWLESDADPRIDNRIVDTYLVWAFYLLAGAYYFVTSYIAFIYAGRAYAEVVKWIILGAHVVIGIVMAVIVIRRVPTRTTTPTERRLARARALSTAGAGSTAAVPTAAVPTAAVPTAGSAAAGPAAADSAAATSGIDIRVNTDDVQAATVLHGADEQISA